MSRYADLIKLALALVLCAGVAMWGRSCGRDAGLKQGEKERASLEEALAKSNRDLSACTASVGLANNIADQAAAEAIRQQQLAEQAAARAAQAEKAAATRIKNLEAQLAKARQNPDAAAQLDLELHPSIPLL